MTDQNANVVLTADTSGYTQGVQQAQVSTDRLISSVDALSSKLDGITKRAGKKLVIFGAADLAALTGAVALAARFEDQTKTLESALTKSSGSMKQYTLTINEMARTMPVARGEIASLVTQMTQMGVVGADASKKIATSMLQLSAVTGESVGSLTTNMIMLSKQMNTMASGSGAVERFSNSLFAVSKSAGVSADGVLSFAQNLAPFARAAGIGEKSLMGISAAFNAAGADGYAAANTFNTMIADITRSIQNGSPDITKYSNLIGVTVEQFKQMDATDRITKIFDVINQQGPKAIRTLDQLGFDGIRAAKAIQGVAQSGNMRAMIEEATTGYNSQSVADTANNVSWAGMASQLTKIKNNMEEAGATVGTALLPPMTAVLTVTNKILDTANMLAAPFLKLGGLLAGGAGLASTAIGGAMTLLGPLSNIAMGAYALRSRPVRGLLGGLSAGMQQAAEGGVTRGLGLRMAEEHAAGRMPWYQSPFYMAGRGFGGALGGPNLGGQNYLGRALTTPFRALTWFARSTQDFYDDSATNGENRRQAFAKNMMRDARVSGVTLSENRRLEKFGKWLEDEKASGRLGAAQATALMEAERKLALETIRAAGTMEQVAVAGREAAAALGKASLANLRAGASNIGQGVAAAGRGLWSMVGGGPMAALAGGMALYSMWSGANDAHQQGITEAARNPISEYNAKLGLATDNLTKFSDVVQESSKKYNSVNDALTDLGNASRMATTTAEYTSTIVKDLNGNDPGAGLAFLRSVGGQLNSQNTQSVMADLYRKYGSSAAGIISQFQKSRNYGASGEDVASILGSADVQNSGLMRVFHGFTTEAGDNVTGTISGNIETAASGVAKTGDLFKAGQVRSSLTVDAIARIVENLAKGKIQDETGVRAIQGIEQNQIGGQIGFWSEDHGQSGWTKAAADYAGKKTTDLTNADIKKWLKEKALPDNPEFKKWYEAQTSQGYDPFMDPNKAYTMSHSVTDPVVQKINATGLGGFSKVNPAIQNALDEGYGSPRANLRAVDEMVNGMLQKTGGSASKMVTSFDEMISAIDNVNDRLSQLGQAALTAWQGLQSIRQTSRGTNGAVNAVESIGSLSALINAPTTDANAESQNTARTTRAQQLAGVVDYYRQYAMALTQFQTQMDRAQHAYDLQVRRSNDSFHRQQLYSEHDYYRQRLWNQEDFNTQMARSAEEAAKTVYNPWQRVYSQLTSGAANMRDNLSEQNDELSKQVANLKKAHQLGLSENTIRTLDLANPQNAQQLDALIQDMIANPAFVKEINAQTARRLALTKALTQNNDNSAYANAVADFRKQQRRNDTVFHESMSRAKTEFGIAMANMAEDHATAVKNAKEDMSKYNAIVEGDFNKIEGITKKLMSHLGVSNQYIASMAARLANDPNLRVLLNDPYLGATQTPGTGGRPASTAPGGNTSAPGSAGSPGARGGTRSSTSVTPMSADTSHPTMGNSSIGNGSFSTTNNRTTNTVNHVNKTTNVQYNYFTKTGPVVANDPKAIYNAINAQNKINALQGKKANSPYF